MNKRIWLIAILGYVVVGAIGFYAASSNNWTYEQATSLKDWIDWVINKCFWISCYATASGMLYATFIRRDIVLFFRVAKFGLAITFVFLWFSGAGALTNWLLSDG